MTTKHRFDVISIFPDYLSPVNLSLMGKAISSGLVEIEVTDLRDFTTDIHKTVDDTPYGGGAGMVMSPVPWGEAIDSIISSHESISHELIVLTPAGTLFTQEMAVELSSAEHLIFACGRYEGIDHRVTEHYQSRSEVKVREVSIGNYVLGGGEVAALVILEAVIRLIPGVIGNPQSLAEESHSLGDSTDLVEYPNYTKPPLWRGLEVPEILLSGNHGRIADWRKKAAAERTAKIANQTGE